MIWNSTRWYINQMVRYIWVNRPGKLMNVSTREQRQIEVMFIPTFCEIRVHDCHRFFLKQKLWPPNKTCTFLQIIVTQVWQCFIPILLGIGKNLVEKACSSWCTIDSKTTFSKPSFWVSMLVFGSVSPIGSKMNCPWTIGKIKKPLEIGSLRFFRFTRDEFYINTLR